MLAVLIASIALSVGVGIFSLLFGEIQVSGTARDSVVAFYASDAGMECALYWELKDPLNSPFAISDTQKPINCANNAPTLVGGPDGSSDFYLKFSGNPKSCTHVMVTKSYDADHILNTRVVSLGENRDQCDITPTSARVVQQGFELNK